jgi:hypothetical protein
MMTRRYLEKKSTVLGLPMQAVGVLTSIGILLIVTSSILKLITPNVQWFNHGTVVVLAGSYGLLRYAATKKHPSFLSSWASFYLLQRKRFFLPSVSRIILSRHEKTEKH